MRPHASKINHIRKVLFMTDAAAKKIQVCIDACGCGGLKGRAYHPALGPLVRFSDINQLWSNLEEVFNAIEYPAASTKCRAFGRKKQDSKGNKERQAMAQKKTAGICPAGKKATFIVQVMYRQNATWQGQVVWSEKNETRQFRSALELVKLIDSAVEESGL